MPDSQQDGKPGEITAQTEIRAVASFFSRHKELLLSTGLLASTIFTGWLIYRDMLLDAHARSAQNGAAVQKLSAIVVTDPEDPTKASLMERISRLERDAERSEQQRVTDEARRLEEYRSVMERFDTLGNQIMSLREAVAGLKGSGGGGK